MSYKKTLLIFTCIGSLFQSFSQDEPKRFAADRIRYSKEVAYQNDLIFSVGATTDFAIGDWKKFSNMGMGLEGGLWYHFDDTWSISSRFGFSRWFGKQYLLPGSPLAKYENQSQWYLYAGGRYNFTQTWWVNPEIGYSHVTFDQVKGGGFSWGLNAGADIYGPASIIGIGIGYQQMEFDNKPRNQVGLRLRFYIGAKREKYDETEGE